MAPKSQIHVTYVGDYSLITSEWFYHFITNKLETKFCTSVFLFILLFLLTYFSRGILHSTLCCTLYSGLIYSTVRYSSLFCYSKGNRSRSADNRLLIVVDFFLIDINLNHEFCCFTITSVAKLGSWSNRLRSKIEIFQIYSSLAQNQWQQDISLVVNLVIWQNIVITAKFMVYFNSVTQKIVQKKTKTTTTPHYRAKLRKIERKTEWMNKYDNKRDK